jgi:hypothetical protein
VTLRRLITIMTGVDERAVQALPQAERIALARECLRLLRATGLTPPAPKGGILGDLHGGARAD